MPERVLIIKAKGGFGNRMLSAVTGVVIADVTGRTPLIDWRDGGYMPAGVNAYPLLFDAPVGLDVAAYDDRTDVFPAIWSGRLELHPVDIISSQFPSKHSSPFIYRRLSVDLARPQVDEDVAVYWSYLPKTARIRRLTRSSDGYRGLSDDEIVRSVLSTHFRPNERVRTTLDGVFAGLNVPVIGVHVRYTDRKAPLDKIESSLELLKSRNPDAKVFLATDSAMVQERIMARFGEVLAIDKLLAVGDQTLHDEVPFDDPLREAENALIDMWALSRCTWMIHSRNSTFSVAAALIGGIPKSSQVDVDRHNPKVVVKRAFQSRA